MIQPDDVGMRVTALGDLNGDGQLEANDAVAPMTLPPRTDPV